MLSGHIRRRCGRSDAQRQTEIVRIPRRGSPTQAWKPIFEDLQPLGRKLGCGFSDTGDGTPRASKAFVITNFALVLVFSSSASSGSRSGCASATRRSKSSKPETVHQSRVVA
jgi:hypothetical protein